MVQTFTDTLRHMPMNVSSSEAYNEANIFLRLIEYELNSLLGASHLVDYIPVHIRFDLERYLLNRPIKGAGKVCGDSLDLHVKSHGKERTGFSEFLPTD